MSTSKKTLVLGASANPSRYSYLAMERLLAKGHPVVAIGLKAVKVHGVMIETEKLPFDDVNTVTLYLGAERQREYYDYIISLKPRRVIFNPGAENEELAALLDANGIDWQESCTLVMLSTYQY